MVSRVVDGWSGRAEYCSDGLAETERGGSGPGCVGGVSSGGALVMVCLLALGHYQRLSFRVFIHCYVECPNMCI